MRWRMLWLPIGWLVLAGLFGCGRAGVPPAEHGAPIRATAVPGNAPIITTAIGTSLPLPTLLPPTLIPTSAMPTSETGRTLPTAASPQVLMTVPVPTSTNATANLTPPRATAQRPLPGPPPALQPLPTVEPSASTGEVPADLLAAIIADLATRARVDQQAVAVVRAEAVIWNDGSLGCPQPGVAYTQAPVSGYRVVLRAGSRNYDYRASSNGTFFVCEPRFLQQIRPTNPGGSG